ncbi:hypothetical protein H8E65_08275 [Candidatus Bathyarchaeota archaeon]|nr:hypothetical protein [Candidatus Bathyarchaeota archaeon]
MEEREAIEALLMEHFERRPKMRATDVYKLLFQGVFGVSHILSDGARKRLQEEAESLDIYDHPTEPLIERISADGSVVRVNLRPYLRRGFPLDRLYEAMEETSKDRGSPEKFLFAWSVFHELVSSGAMEVDGEELASLHRDLQEKGPCPHHHSEPYRVAYYPAYRVVKREALEKIPRFQG